MAKINKEEYETLKGMGERWKWIARDSAGSGNRGLFTYSEKPYKHYNQVWSTDDDRALLVDSHLFQFIQWEDSEPYNIQELIDGYLDDEYGYFNMKLSREFEEFVEIESEETEVKRDKEDLVKYLEKEISNFKPGEMIYDYLTFILKQLNELEGLEVKKLYERIGGLESYNDELIRDNNQLRNELDNQEVLSPEWIEENEQSIDYRSIVMGKFVESNKLHLLVKKQELPVIPKFVANWIEDNKQFEEKWNDYSKGDAMNDTIHFTIYGLFADYPATNSHVELRKPVLKWLRDDRGNYFKLVNAVRYGYELEEEEQKYYIDLETAAYVAKWKGNDQVDIYTDGISGSDEYEFHLTEREIKDYDERFWPFRKPVEEME